MVKRILISSIGTLFSIAGIIGIILSNAFSEILLFVITTISGLFTLAISSQEK
jgi:hypothetical protein